MQTRVFTVDARLLGELGERLVGRPHIALAELIKNAYDADARHVELTFDSDRILVVDDGHGMTEDAFVERWMRIGTTAKSSQRHSPALRRPLTGSKGVGRLAVQLLAERLDLNSVGLVRPSSLTQVTTPRLSREIVAGIRWPDALDHQDLTDVTVDFDLVEPNTLFASGSRHGTSIALSQLTHTWTADAFEALAREIWALQPPFSVGGSDGRKFRVTLRTPYPSVQASFDKQMSALMKIASATITGRLLPPGERGPRRAQRFELPSPRRSVDEDGQLAEPELERHDSEQPSEKAAPPLEENAPGRSLLVEVHVVGAPKDQYVIEIPSCQIAEMDFEIRVFDLHHRQPHGIKVDVARGYLNDFGGVHLYDNGFRLPYYGPEQDWLRLELDHARRLSRSELVPEELQVRNAMQDLPSNKRVFGAVNISTSFEQAEAEVAGRRASDALSIQITRDRLVDNAALAQLTRAVRLALDLYALTRAKSKARGQIRRRGGVRPDSTDALRRASTVVEALRDTLPETEYQTLKDSIDTVADEVTTQRKEARAYASLLGALATAGMTSLAYEHEISKQRQGIASIARNLRRIARTAPPAVHEPLMKEADTLVGWKDRSSRIRDLFRPLLEEESRTAVERYSAAKVLAEVVDTMAIIRPAAEVDTAAVPAHLLLPAGSYAAWTAVFQNLLTNAFKATADNRPARIAIDAGSDRHRSWIRLQDNGVGMNLADAERLFQPFERGGEDSEKVEALGLGGSGLGLTIVRMIADELSCTVAFDDPEPGWSTAVRVEWKV